MSTIFFLHTRCTKCYHPTIKQVEASDCEGIEFGKKMFIELASRINKCSGCDKKTSHEINLERQFICGFDIAIKNEPKTVGHWASRNTERLGRGLVEDEKFKYQESRRKAAKKTAEAAGCKLMERNEKIKPWWRDGTIPGVRKYDKATQLPAIKDTQKYIETGEIS